METPAQLAQRAADAADWGFCLECGCEVDALAGEVLCKPCDDEAAEHEAAMEQLASAVLPRLLAELAEPLPPHTERQGVWKREHPAPPPAASWAPKIQVPIAGTLPERNDQ